MCPFASLAPPIRLPPYALSQAPDSCLPSISTASSLVRISASIILIAAPGLLCSRGGGGGGSALARAAVSEAALYCRPLHILAPPSMAAGAPGLKALLGAEAPSVVSPSRPSLTSVDDDGVPHFSEQVRASGLGERIGGPCVMTSWFVTVLGLLLGSFLVKRIFPMLCNEA